MPKKATHVYPASQRELESFGQRLREARLRRRFSVETVCLRAAISRPTLYKVEKGDPSVSLGIYMQILRVLALTKDLSFVAKEDKVGRRIQDESLPLRQRAPRRKDDSGGNNG